MANWIHFQLNDSDTEEADKPILQPSPGVCFFDWLFALKASTFYGFFLVCFVVCHRVALPRRVSRRHLCIETHIASTKRQSIGGFSVLTMPDNRFSGSFRSDVLRCFVVHFRSEWSERRVFSHTCWWPANPNCFVLFSAVDLFPPAPHRKRILNDQLEVIEENFYESPHTLTELLLPLRAIFIFFTSSQSGGRLEH